VKFKTVFGIGFIYAHGFKSCLGFVKKVVDFCPERMKIPNAAIVFCNLYNIRQDSILIPQNHPLHPFTCY